jgi:hypothetical protein
MWEIGTIYFSLTPEKIKGFIPRRVSTKPLGQKYPKTAFISEQINGSSRKSKSKLYQRLHCIKTRVSICFG